MKIWTLLTAIVIFCLAIEESQTASIVCDENYKVNKTESADNKGIKNFLHSIQCSLEKAKPWMDELEQEAKRLEAAAKRLGFGILHTFGEFMDKLVGDIQQTGIKNESLIETELTPKETTTTPRAVTTVTAIYASDTDNEISADDDRLHLCPEGFVMDHNDLCERIHNSKGQEQQQNHIQNFQVDI
uniref:Protein TsetseEP domain-containing protein n=1 Tax=Glossina pallidipes TaxID=7398 RepID=A0A1B0ADJ9_GLOPL